MVRRRIKEKISTPTAIVTEERASDGMEETLERQIHIQTSSNPCSHLVQVAVDNLSGRVELSLHVMSGRICVLVKVSSNSFRYSIKLHKSLSATYIINYEHERVNITIDLIKGKF